ncbi:MAG: S8 family serine peptidase [Bacteroidia bacterium]
MSLRQITQNPFFHWSRFFFGGLIGGVILALVGLFGRVHAQSTEELTKNLPPRLETEGVLYEFKSLRDGGLPPLYYQTYNLGAAQTSRTSRLWPGGGLGLQLSGQRLTLCCLNGPNGSQPYFYDPKVGIWDGGGVRATHQELVGRVTQRDAANSSDNHATHVAGTMIASGEQPTAKGMAYSAKLDAYDWNSDESEMATAAAQGLLMSNHSYGLVTGWAYGDFDGQGTSRWFWWGDESDTVCADFGLYSQQARDWDLIANNAPHYLMVKAAGNDRGQGPSAGTTHRAWSNSQGNWVNSTVTRQKDGGPLGYDCISHAGLAKNVLTIGAVQGITGAYTGPSQVIGSTFHGWGPTDDGRIKPDIVAKGVGVYSTTAASDVSYASYNGTSMASPVVTGTLALLQQRWTEINAPLLGSPPPPMTSAQLKALVCHTALEAGLPGPDPVFGWGLLNAEGAVQVLAGRGDSTLVESLTLTNSGTYSRSF